MPHLNGIATLPSEMLVSHNSVPYMLGHCFLKYKVYKLTRDMTWQAATVVTEASHSKLSVISPIDLESQIDEYHNGVAQFQHAVRHCYTVRIQHFAPTSLFFAQPDAYTLQSVIQRIFQRR